MNMQEYRLGMRDSIPVGLGYLSVSFGFGAKAVADGAAIGINALVASVISLTNVTSAGQYAGLKNIVEQSGLWLLILTQLIINSRYALMSLALSQKMQGIGILARLRIAFVNTDEVFALAMARKESLTVPYLFGLGVLPVLGWVTGTALGALVGSVLPASIAKALGVMLFGMFVAIVVPPARKQKSVAAAIALAILFSCLFAGLLAWMPELKEKLTGVPILVSTIAAAAICAAVFPVEDEA